MPSDISGISAQALIINGRQALDRIGATPSTRRVDAAQLSDGVEASRFINPENRPLLSVAEAETALATATTAARGVLDALAVLRGALRVSENTALVSTNANLLDLEGSRVSRVNFQAEARVLLNRIEGLIEEAEFAGANFISSAQSVIRVQTTNFGGQVSINTQPLEPDSLGLTSRNLISDRDLREFFTQLDEAIIQADLRLSRLEEVERVVGNADGQSQALARALSNGTSSTLPAGSLINLFG